MIDLFNPAHAPSIEFRKKVFAGTFVAVEKVILATEVARVAAMGTEERLAYLSRRNAPRGCRWAGCYGRGYVGRQGETFIPCPKCSG